MTLECQVNACEKPRCPHALVFCEKWESGGVEAFVTTLLECMDLARVRVDLAACRVQPGPYDARLAALGVAPIALGETIRDFAGNLRAFRELLEKGVYDVVHLNVYEGAALAFARAAKKAGVARVIVHSHNNDLRPSATRALKLAMHRACAGLLGRYADVRWAPSEAAGRFMFGKRPFTLVRNGIVPERFAFDADVRERLRTELGFAPGCTVLGCVGRLCEQKNQLFLVDVLAALPESACLLLVGEDDGGGSYEAALRRRASELHVLECVRFYGRTNDTAPLYQAMDMLCVPSTFEALGIVAVEAQAAGLPVVASTAVPREAYAGGEMRRIPLDASQWVAAVADAPADSASRAKGMERVARAGYDMRAVAAEVAGAYGVRPVGSCGATPGDHGYGLDALVDHDARIDDTPRASSLVVNGDLVSVIVPVYNVVEYVGECLESLRAQTHRNIEVIVVDDGSNDGSGRVCDEFAAADSRFKVVHQANKGLSAARNTGIEMARGGWLAFVDSDDVVSPCYIKALLAPGSDIAQCMFTCEYGCLMPSLDVQGQTFETRTGREASLALQLDSTGAATVVWNKLYRRSLFDGVRFPAGRQHEDEFVTYRLLWQAGSVATCSAPLYYYRQRQGSIMGTGVTAKTVDAFVALEERAAFYRAKGDERLACLSEAVLCNRVGSCLEGLTAVDPGTSKVWGDKRDALLRCLLKSPHISAKKKLALLLQRTCPGLYGRAKGR